MSTEDETGTPKKKVRGRKLGVKIFQEVYQPEMIALFDTKIKILGDRASWKEQELLEAIKSQLPFDEIQDQILSLLRLAEKKEAAQNKLEKEVAMLREKADKIMEMTKTIKFSNHNGYGDMPSVSELEIVHTTQILDMLKISMMLQPEWLTLEEMKAMKKEYLSKLNRCVTMDQCTEFIDEARATIAAMSK